MAEPPIKPSASPHERYEAGQDDEPFYDPLDALFEDDEIKPRNKLPFILSIAAVTGFVWLAWYAYNAQNSISDISQVPLITASEEPFRVKPADPGGMHIPYRDKTVYETLQRGNKNILPKVERVLPAPESPTIAKPTEDSEKLVETRLQALNPPQKQPQVEMIIGNKEAENEGSASKPAPVEATYVTDDFVETALAPAQPRLEDAEQAETQQNPNRLTLAAAIQEESGLRQPAEGTSRADESPSAEPALSEKSSPDESASTEQAAADGLEVAEAFFQPRSPDNNAELSPSERDATSDVATAPNPNPIPTAKPDGQATPKAPNAQPAASGYRLQLGAFRSESEAKERWQRISSRFSSLLSDKRMAVEKADLNEKGIFYRLHVAPMADKAEADRLCSALSEKKQGCFVVKR